MYPNEGEKRLPVGIALRRSSDFEKLVCDFGDGTLPISNELIIDHVYESAGTFHGSIMVFKKRLDNAPTQTIEFTVKVRAPSEPNLVGSVGLSGDKAVFYKNQKVQFDMTHPTVPNAAAFNEISWDFGDGSSISGKSTHVDHRYQRAGKYTATVTVTMDKFDTERGRRVTITDSKSCSFLVLPDDYY